MDNSHQIRAIVPGRQGKTLNAATLRPVVVERLNEEGPLTLGNVAIKLAEKTFKDFHAVYSALYVMIALPEAEPNPLFEAIWQMLMLPDSEKEISIKIYNPDDYVESIDVQNLPRGWTYSWESFNCSMGEDTDDEDADENDDPNGINPLGLDMGTPYNNTNHL